MFVTNVTLYSYRFYVHIVGVKVHDDDNNNDDDDG